MNKKNIKEKTHNAMYQNIRKKGWVAPVDVLMDIGVLTKESYENWRRGRVDYLERNYSVNLSQLSAIMHTSYSGIGTVKKSKQSKTRK